MEIDQKEQESKQNRKKVGRIDLKKNQKEKESKNRAKAEETKEQDKTKK